MKQKPLLFEHPAILIIGTGLIIGSIQLLIMASLSIACHNPFFNCSNIAGPVLLISLLSPGLYFLVLKPMRERHASLEQTVSQRTQELELANRDLRTREELLNQILETANVGIFVTDEQGRITRVNQMMATMFASSPESMIGIEYITLVDPAEVESSRVNSKRVRQADEVVMDVDRRYIRADQTQFWGYLTGRSFRQEGQSDRTIVYVISDITERKNAQEAQRIAATAFESQQGMMIIDTKGAVLQVNKAFTEITGYTSGEVIGTDCRQLSSGRQDPAFYAAMRKCVHSTGSWQGEILNQRKNGEVYPEWLSLSAVKDAKGAITHYVSASSDRSAYKASEQRLEYLAFYDALSQLPNRALLLDRLRYALASAARHGHQGALLLIDLDNFKIINDTLGHEQGDLLIQQVAKRLSSCVRESDTLARVGGDEFIVLLVDLSQDDQTVANRAKIIGDKILTMLREPYALSGTMHHSSASIGITLFDGRHQEKMEEPLKQVELAMYQAKSAGRDTLRFFDPHMQAVVSNRADLESRLREALAQNNFMLHYQAQVDDQGQITGSEALVRWLDPKRGMISPGEFIPLAEETGLILPLGKWILDTACTELSRWADEPTMAHLTLSVNVSARQFHQKDFVEQVLNALKRTGANAHRLKLELTESMLVHDIEGVIAKMGLLKSNGVSFSLDDFGTGYSSLVYLKRLPLDQLKIDQGFVCDILLDANDAAIAKMVIALADSMGLRVIAEGVETLEQREFLADMGCPSYQGYLFSRPLPLQDFEALVKRGNACAMKPDRQSVRSVENLHCV